MGHEPLQFIDSLDAKRHIVLFYEEPKWALVIEFRFINNGLLKGEHCIYTTHGDTMVIEDEMASAGIDVEGFKRKNLLRVHKIPNPMDDPDGSLKGAEKIKNRILTNSKPPFRIVSKIIPETNTEEQMAAIIDIEHNDHIGFNKFQGSLLCPYYIEKIEPRKHAKWITELLQNHHAAIFAPTHGSGIAFDMR